MSKIRSILILLIIFLIFVSCKTTNNSDVINGITTKGMHAKNLVSNDEVWIQHSTDLEILEVNNEFVIAQVSGLSGSWNLKSEYVLIEDSEIIEYKSNRLLSTYSEGPYDGYSWHQRRINFKMNETLFKETLLSTIWIPINYDPGFLLVFFSDDKFMYGAYDSGLRTRGSYQIVDDSIILNDIEVIRDTHSIDNYFSRHKKIILNQKNISLFYSNTGLQSSDEELNFYAVGAEPEKNSIIIIENIECKLKRFDAGLQDITDFEIFELKRLNPNTEEYLFSSIESNIKVEIIAKELNDEKNYYCAIPINDEFYSHFYIWIPQRMIE